MKANIELIVATNFRCAPLLTSVKKQMAAPRLSFGISSLRLLVSALIFAGFVFSSARFEVNAANGILSESSTAAVVGRPELVLQTGHAMRVDGVAFSTDGQLLASASADNTVRLWDTATRREVRTLTGHAQGVKAVAFSRDGRTLASGSIDGQIKLWDVANGHELRTLSGGGSITFIAFSFDGQRIASGNMEKIVKLWDVSSGRELNSLTGHTKQITALAFSPNGEMLASGSADNAIKLWNTATGTEARTLSGHKDRITSLVFDSTGQTLFSASFDSTVKLWKTNKDQAQRTLQGNGGKLLAVALSIDGRSVLAVAANNDIKVWDAASGRISRSVSAPASDNPIESIAVAFSSDAATVATSSGDKTVSLRDTATGRDVRALTTHSYGVYATAFSRDGKWFASGGKENTVKLWETATGRELYTLDPNGGFVGALAFSPDGAALASGSLSGVITLWDSSTGQKLRTLSGHESSVNGVAFSPDGKTLASASGDNAVKLWDAATGRELRTLAGHTAEVNAVAFSPDGKFVASGSADKTLKLWDAATGREVRAFAGHAGEVLAVAFSPDGKLLASGSVDNTAKLWNAATGTEARTLAGHTAEVKALAFSPDGRTLVTGSKDNSIKLWDAASGQTTRTLTGHDNEIDALAFNADGRWFASGSDDGSTRIWDAKSGDWMATLVSLRENTGGLSTGQTNWIVVSPDGLFDGSPAAWNQILWRFEQNTFNVRPVEVFFNDFFYPGLLADILAGKKPRAPQDIAQIDRRQPQVSLITSDREAAAENVATRDLAIKISVAEAPPDKDHPAGSGARDVRLFRNGALVKVWHGDALENKNGKTILETTLPVVAGANQLTAYAFNRNDVKSADATLTITGADSLKQPATAYVVAVGINSYSNAGYNLKFAVPDAGDFSGEVERRQQNLLGRFAKTEVVSLSDSEATKANMLLALNRLSGVETGALPKDAPAGLEKLKPVQPEDTVVIFFAGHGIAYHSRFYLLPHDLGYAGSRRRLTEAGFQTILDHSVSDRELETAFEKVSAGQILLVLDACNSGQALEAEEKRRGPMNSKGLAQLAYEKGMYILTAAQSYQAALEATELGHGLLTYALIEEGLKKNLADVAPHDGRVLLQEWLDYATNRVPEMQEQKMQQGRSVGANVAFVEGEENVSDVQKRSVQRPRVFYRRDTPIPLIAISAQAPQ